MKQGRPMWEKASERPIGIFDSGLGGLSVLRMLRERLPLENYIYFGDTARAPYGGRSGDEIRRFNIEIGGWLLARGCKMLVVACNTSTVLGGLAALKAETPIPVYGMMEATLAGTLAIGEGAGGIAVPEEIWPIGFIATKGTVESGAYQAAFGDKAPGKPFYALACPDFVPLVEQGKTEGPDVDQAVHKYLAMMNDKKIRTLILGCTHYPFLVPAIVSFIGENVRIVDPAVRLAHLVEGELKKSDLLNDGAGDAHGAGEYWCSGDTGIFKAVGGIFMGSPIDEVRKQVF